MPKLIKDKKRILKVCQNLKKDGFTYAKIAQVTGIDTKTLYNIRKLPIEQIDKGIKRVSFMHTLTDEMIKYVIDEAINNSYFRASLLIANFRKIYKIVLSSRQIYIILKENNITYKKVVGKNKYCGKKIEQKEIEDKKKQVKERRNVIFIDEVHIDLADISNYGWNEKGKEVIFDEIVPKEIKNKRITVIAAVSRTKKIGYKIYHKSVNGDKFSKFVKYISKKTNSKNIFLDNARIHSAGIVKNTYDKYKMRPIYGVPYTPFLNIIENFFRSFKSKIRSIPLSTRINIDNIIRKSWNDVNTSVLNNTFSNVYG